MRLRSGDWNIEIMIMQTSTDWQFDLRNACVSED